MRWGLVLVVLLAGCAGGAVDERSVIEAGRRAAAVNGAVMSEAEAGACLVQSVANLTGGIAVVSGEMDVARGAAVASAASGLTCRWETVGRVSP